MILTMVITGTAEEGFAFQDSIKWGMSAKEVKKIEESISTLQYDRADIQDDYAILYYTGEFYKQDAQIIFIFSNDQLEEIEISYFLSADHDVIKTEMTIEYGKSMIDSFEDFVTFYTEMSKKNGASDEEIEVTIDAINNTPEEEKELIANSMQVWSQAETIIIYINNDGFAEVYYMNNDTEW